MLPQINQELLEKPESKEDNLRMLLDMNGNVCEVVTGVVIGVSLVDILDIDSRLASSLSYSYLTGIPDQVRLRCIN